jgi:ankyrin repeat protein
MAISSLYSEAQHSRRIQSQILHEAVQKSKVATADSSFFLACCYALGLGADADIQKSLEHLEQAADFGHTSSLAILDRLAQAMGYQTEMGLDKMVQDTRLSLDYSERIKQTKAMISERGDFMGIKIWQREPISHGFRTPARSSGQAWLLDDNADIEVRRKRVSCSRTFQSPTPKGSDDPLDLYKSRDPCSLVLEYNDNMRRLKEIDGSFEESLTKIKEAEQKLSSMARPHQGGLFHLAVNFFGCDSSFKIQLKILQLVQAVEKYQGNVDLDRPNGHGETPLLVACRCGQALTVRYLVSIGAHPRPADKSGLTPLHWLGFFGDDETENIGRLLVGAGAPLDARTTGLLDLPEHCFNLQKDCTPLHFAVAMRNLAAVRTLLSLGADPFATAKVCLAFNGYGMTPLHFAICLHFHEIVKELIQIPGTSSEVMFRRTGEKEGPISIVHLVSVHLFLPSDMSPFARWILHGDHYEEAVQKTLDNIFCVFPDRKVLVFIRHFLSVSALPAQDPYIWRIFKKLGVGPKRLTPEEMGLQPGSTVHQGQNYEVELWARAAVDGSHLDQSSPRMMDLALSGFEDGQIELEPSFFFQIVKTCITDDMDGPLSALFDRPHLRETARPVMPPSFWKAAGLKALGVMRLVWKVFIDGAHDQEAAKREV